MRIFFYSFFFLLILIGKSNSITPLNEVQIYCVWADPKNSGEAFYQHITDTHFYILDEKAKDCRDIEEDLYLVKKSENNKIYKKLYKKYFKEDCCVPGFIGSIDSNLFNLIKDQVPKYKKIKIKNEVNNYQPKKTISEDNQVLEKFENLINYRIKKKKVITLNQIKELYFPQMTQPPYSRDEELNESLYEYFVEYSEKSKLKDPGYIFDGLRSYEHLYQFKLYKYQKKIKKIIEKSQKNKKTNFKDANLISLMEMRDNILLIRKNLGIPEEKTTEEVLEYYRVMYKFFSLDEYEVIPTQRTDLQRKEKFYINNYIRILNEIKKTLDHAKINS